DHGQRRPVLDRAGRIVAFELDQEGVAGLAGQPFQLHQRGIADEILQRVVHAHLFRKASSRTYSASSTKAISESCGMVMPNRSQSSAVHSPVPLNTQLRAWLSGKLSNM